MAYEQFSDSYNDVGQSVEYLNRAFARARKDYVDATNEKSIRPKWGEPTTIYKYEVDFCYLINEVQQGSSYSVVKNIAEANELIRNLVSDTKS